MTAGSQTGATARRDPPEATRSGLASLDEIERFAALLVLLGIGLVTWAALVSSLPPFEAIVVGGASNWAPGLLLDGVLLWVVNRIIRRNERTRVLSQMGSLSREFALDATRRAREEGWLTDGGLAGHRMARASLRGADLSAASLSGADLSFADLRETTLAYGDLRGADLTGADLREADLRWADLTDAKLQWADLRSAMLDGTHLDGADAQFASVDARQAERSGLEGAIVGGFLDQDQVAEIRRTFDLFSARGRSGGERFYERLFERAPETRALFRTEPALQARKFVQMLKVILSALHTPTRHVAVLQTLGERHRGYGVHIGHYAHVGEALIDVIEETLGPEFTPAARSAWERAFELMTAIMAGGAAAPDRDPADGGAEASGSRRKRFAVEVGARSA